MFLFCFFDRLSFLMLFCCHRGFLSLFVISITISIKIGKLVTHSHSLPLSLSLLQYMYHFCVSNSHHITPPPTAHGEAIIMAVSFTGCAGRRWWGHVVVVGCAEMVHILLARVFYCILIDRATKHFLHTINLNFFR